MPALVDDIGVAVLTRLAEHGIDRMVENSAKTKNVLARAWKHLFDGRVSVIITGLGGAGKTSLQKIISGQKKAEELDGHYHISSTNERTELRENSFVAVYTRPGQPDWYGNADVYEELFKALSKSRKIKVINVVSFGYDALHRITLDALPSHAEGQGLDVTLRAYLEQQRAMERERLAELVTLLGSMPASKTINILTVINKADLWHDRNAEVVRYYEGTNYGAVIAAMTASNGGRITHSMTSGSLIPVNLRTQDGFVLAPVLSGFDLHMRRRYLENLINDVREFFK